MTKKREYELVLYDCQDGDCLMIHEKTTDSKLGALSLDHKSIGEDIVDELNYLATKLHEEELRTIPIVLDTHISDEDFKKIESMLKQKENDIIFSCAQNCYEDFNKDTLHVKDNNTEIRLKNRELFIQVFIPSIKEYMRFKYMVTGRRLE